jgi:hypothetical protein
MARLQVLERSAEERITPAVGRRHRPHKVRVRVAGLLSAFTAPMIYAQLVPLMLLDLFVTAYQWACFPIYGIDRVPRGPYFWLDRHRLPYLNALEKLNCTYCGYANGVIAYVREVTARTEAYWCPIKHRRPVSDPHDLYQAFFRFGDEMAYRRAVAVHRQALRRQRERARQR